MQSCSELLFHSTNRPCAGQSKSGDAVFLKFVESGALVAIVDVLGHGLEASKLAKKIIEFLEKNCSEDLVLSMNNLHNYLVDTRGAAIGLCFCDLKAQQIFYVGIGNTVIRKFGDQNDQLASLDGTVGLYMRTPKLLTMPISKGDVILLYTDGITSRFRSEQYPNISLEKPEQISQKVVALFGKDYDDAACAVLKIK